MSDALYGRHLYVNIGIAFASFVDGEAEGQLSTDDATPANTYRWLNGSWVQVGSGGAAHVDASPDCFAVTQHNTTDDPNGPFIGMRFDAAGTVSFEDSAGVDHAITVLAGEYFPGVIVRVNDDAPATTSLTDAQMVGFRRT